MTGVAKKMKAGGYKTHMVGKWDAGMATPEHSPLGKGYDTWLGYFQHANDYWQESMPLASTGNLDVCLNECHAWSKCGKFFLFFFFVLFFPICLAPQGFTSVPFGESFPHVSSSTGPPGDFWTHLQHVGSVISPFTTTRTMVQ